jgi:catechol 2,3-dioxygenase
VAPRSRLGLFHFAILLPDRAALGRFILHLAAQGIRAGAADHLVSEALYLSDPDGLGIEIYADRPRTEWDRNGQEIRMGTDPLDLRSVAAAGGYHHHVGLNVWAEGAPAPDAHDAQLLHWDIRLGSPADLDAACARLERHYGVDAPQHCERTAEGAVVRDPWGTTLRLLTH